MSVVALGLESSANKIGVGIVDEKGVIYSNCRKTYITPPGEGFLPRETANHHRSNAINLIKQALSEVSKKRITVICYTKGPGMASPLLVGAICARTLSKLWGLPIIGVNHCIGHIEMGKLITQAKNPTILYVSGGNTQILSYQNHRYAIVGETLDIAIGNCFDRVARLLSLSNDPSPGQQIEIMAKNFNGQNLLSLPYVVKGMDVSFSGMVNSLQTYLIPQNMTHNSNLYSSLCYSLQEHAFAMLTEVTERAMTQTNSKEVLIVGGVGCNKRLQTMMSSMLSDRQATLCATDERYCIDNGAMIAYTGILQFCCGECTPFNETTVRQKFRADSVNIQWL